MLRGALVALALVAVMGAAPRPQYKIVTASERGTYIEIGRNLAKWVAVPAGIDLAVLPSNGSRENVRRLRDEADVKFALVQWDVYQHVLDEAAAGSAEDERISRGLRVVTPLYNEEIAFVVRRDSPMKFIHEIQDKKLSIGPLHSGTALTATMLYRLMFRTAIPAGRAHHFSNEQALIKLIMDKSIDVAIIVAGQPAKLFMDMKPEMQDVIKLLRRDDKAPAIVRAKTTYVPARIRADSYPSWLKQDVPTLAVKALLVTHDFRVAQTQSHLMRFASRLCANFDLLQRHGHPKWEEVRLNLPRLPKGWHYYEPMEHELRACKPSRPRRG